MVVPHIFLNAYIYTIHTPQPPFRREPKQPRINQSIHLFSLMRASSSTTRAFIRASAAPPQAAAAAAAAPFPPPPPAREEADADADDVPESF